MNNYQNGVMLPLTRVTLLTFAVMLALLAWLSTDIFFFGDDWIFINDYFNMHFQQFVTAPYYGHVAPVFRLTYYSAITLFGKNAILYHASNVILFGIFIYAFFRFLQQLLPGGGYQLAAIATSALLCVHPGFGSVTLSIFQTCITLHILFQAMALLYYSRYVQSNTQKHFNAFLLFLVLQNYSFGNGLFFPLLFIFHQLIEKGLKLSRPVIILGVAQLLFLVIQKLASNQQMGLSYFMDYGLSMVQSFAELIAVSVARFFFIKHFESNIILLAGMALFVTLCYHAFRKNRHLFLFCMAYMILSAITVPIARPVLYHPVNYYYTDLLLPPLFMLLFIAIAGFTVSFPKISTIVFYIFFIVWFFTGGIQMKRIFAYRNFKNKENLYNAVIYGKTGYYPYDDGLILGIKNSMMDSTSHPDVQRSLQKSGYFSVDTTLALEEKQEGNFREIAARNINNFKRLEKQSLIDLDIKYEKR
jgi:hypothetical protein